MSQKLLNLLIGLFLASVAMAQTSGKISGVIKDKTNGEGLPGVNVNVVNTTMGTSTDVDGFYVIQNVPVGVHDVNITYVGYKTVTVKSVRVNVDNTTEVSASLEESVNVGDEVVVTAKQVLIRKEETNSREIRNSEQIKNLPVSSIQDIVAMTVGAVKNDNSNAINLRGGRSAQTAIMINGVTQNSTLDGNVNSTINKNAVEEVTVQSGGFGPQYGGFISGIVNATIKSGNEKYAGNLEYTTDAVNGTNSKYGVNNLNVLFSGPLFNNNYFFVSINKSQADDRNPSWGYTGAKQEGLDLFGAVVNFKSVIGSDMVLKLTGTFDDRTREIYNHNKNFFRVKYGVTTQHQQEQKDQNYNAALSFQYTVNKSFFFEASAGMKMRKSESYDKKHGKNLLAYGDSALNSYKGSLTDFNARFYGKITGKGSAVLKPGSLTSTDESDNLDFDNGGRNGEISALNVISNAYNQGFEKNFNFNFDATLIVDKNTIKFGAEYKTNELRQWGLAPRSLSTKQNLAALNDPRTYVNLIATNNFGYDVFGNSVTGDGKNYFNGLARNNIDNGLPGLNGAVSAKTPSSFSLYIQDVVQFKDIILDFGIRMDRFDPNQKRYKDVNNKVGKKANAADVYVQEDDIEDHPGFTEFQPRLGIAFPVSEATKFSASIGRFVQMPTYNSILMSDYAMVQTVANGSGVTANPNLLPEKSINFEFAINHTLSDDVVLNVRTYFRQINDLITLRKDFALPSDGSSTPQYATGNNVQQNEDFSTAKGFEISVETRRINNLQLFSSYTFSKAVGTGSQNGGGAGAAGFGIKNSYLRDLDFDVPHSILVTADYRYFDNGPYELLNNFGANISAQYQSGQPYTGAQPFDSFSEIDTRNPLVTSAINGLRMPSRFTIDLRLDKGFNINVGENKVDFNVYLDMRNIFNSETVQGVWRTSGNAGEDGWLSNPNSNNDVKVDTEYEREAYRYLLASPGNWGNPRTIQLGLRVNL